MAACTSCMRTLVVVLFFSSQIVSAAAALPYVFVAALPLNSSVGLRESQQSACSRVGLLATPPRVLLGGSSPVAQFWDLSTVSSVVTALGSSYPLASPLVPGCCSPSLWCAAGGGECFTHSPLGADIEYENYGWLLNSTAVPVYTCRRSEESKTILRQRTGRSRNY
jgi:hypothetical protein